MKIALHSENRAYTKHTLKPSTLCKSLFTHILRHPYNHLDEENCNEISLFCSFERGTLLKVLRMFQKLEGLITFLDDNHTSLYSTQLCSPKPASRTFCSQTGVKVLQYNPTHLPQKNKQTTTTTTKHKDLKSLWPTPATALPKKQYKGVTL